MKQLYVGAMAALVGLSNSAQAEYTLNVKGTDYPLVALMDNCRNAQGGSEAQLKCFSALTQLLKNQSGVVAVDVTVVEALDALREAAQHADPESGLSIEGTDCKIQIVYFNNYFQISRRNVSTIDLLSARFDASRLEYDQTTEVQVATMTLAQGRMQDGTKAAYSGGIALESEKQNFAPKSAQASIDEYAQSVIAQLPVMEDQSFNFVLVHPDLQQSRAEIWKAFETFVNACRT